MNSGTSPKLLCEFFVRVQAFIRLLPVALAVVFVYSTAQAREYGRYYPKRILTVSNSPSGTRHGIDLEYLDLILDDLSTHAKNYPPTFDTPQDRQRAIQNIAMLSGMLDILVNDPDPSQEILLRAGYLNSMGHNLDISGSALRAIDCFEKLLVIAPDHPLGNYRYGKFLAESNNGRRALPYLRKAHSLGVVDADYTLGLTCLGLGDKQSALEYLQAYRKACPGALNVDFLINAIRNGNLQFKTTDQ
jgi:tetratricopeptide (TPR) repeat protein